MSNKINYECQLKIIFQLYLDKIINIPVNNRKFNEKQKQNDNFF